MTLRILLVISAIIFVIAGLGFLLAPGECLSTLGLPSDSGGLVFGRIAGQGFLGFAVAFWLARNGEMSADMSAGFKAVVYGGCTFNILGAVVLGWSTIAGQIGPVAWIAVIIHAALALGFIFFGELQRSPVRA